MKSVSPRNLNLTIDQVRELMDESPIRNVREGNQITWRCNHIDPETFRACPYTFHEDVYFDSEKVDWPYWLVEHIWREGHYAMTTNMTPVAGPVRPRIKDEINYRKVVIYSVGMFVGAALGSILGAALR